MSGIFNPSIFNNQIFNVGDVGTEVVKTGTGGIDPKKRIVKPLGPLGKKKVVEARVEDSREIQSEIASRLAKEFSEEIVEPKPIVSMTMAEIDHEIGTLLRKQIRTREDEDLLILLMVATV